MCIEIVRPLRQVKEMLNRFSYDFCHQMAAVYWKVCNGNEYSKFDKLKGEGNTNS